MSDQACPKPPVPQNETERLLALRGLNILDTNPDIDLDQITKLASEICGTPVALITLIDENRQWFKSKVGIDVSETPRDIAFCAHAINKDSIFEVEDATRDPRFASNPLVTNAPHLRFYAGAQLKTSGGMNVGTLCVGDLTPRKLSVQQLAALENLAKQVVLLIEFKKQKKDAVARESFLSSIVNMFPDLVSYVDSSFCYRYINSAYENWFRVQSADVVGKHMSDILGEAAFQKAKPFMEKALAGMPQEFQLTMPYTIQGKTVERVVRAHYIPDTGADGKVVGFYAAVMDISKLKQAEDLALTKSKDLEAALARAVTNENAFRVIFDNSPIGIIELDQKLRFKLANKSYQQFLGYSEEELRNLTVFDVTHPEDRQVTSNLLPQVTEGKNEPTRFTKRYIRKTGEVVWARISTKAVQLVRGGEVLIFSAIEDVTAIRKTESELLEAQSKLVNSSKMASLGEMAGGVAHEISNPLAILRGRLEIVKRKLTDSLADPKTLILDLGKMDATIERIADIVKGLRTFSRNAENDPVQIEAVEDIITESLALCGQRFKDGNVQFNVDSLSDLTLECRKTQICQVLVNLLCNAYDAVEVLPEKWVQLKIETINGVAIFSVTDSGKGISAQVQNRMMEPFFSTKVVGKGTGLGLSISKGIIESHGGKFYYNKESSHTCFVFELPLSQVQALKLAA